MNCQRIIMNYTVSPSLEDIEVMATAMLDILPDELLQYCEALKIAVEELVDEATEEDYELEDAFDLLAVFKSGKEISPGVQSKIASGDDTLILYRRAILDLWCETGEDLSGIIRQIMIEELGRSFDFSEQEIIEMTARPYQNAI
jgi:predicted Zn-dependent protease with MMP-like domain